VSSSVFQRRVLAVGFVVAAAYAAVAVVEVLVGAGPDMAVPFAYTAVSIAGPLAAVAWILGSSSRNEPGGDGPDDDGPGPPGDGHDDPPPPSWWPEFERDFRAHVERNAARRPSRDRARLRA
jgi:hypothetical protein